MITNIQKIRGCKHFLALLLVAGLMCSFMFIGSSKVYASNEPHQSTFVFTKKNGYNVTAKYTWYFTSYNNRIVVDYLIVEFENGLYPRIGDDVNLYTVTRHYANEQRIYRSDFIIDSNDIITARVPSGKGNLAGQNIQFAKKVRINFNNASWFGGSSLLGSNRYTYEARFDWNFSSIETYSNGYSDNIYWYDDNNKVVVYCWQNGGGNYTNNALFANSYHTISAHTTAYITGITYAGVSETEATILWDNPNNNGGLASYTLERRQKGGSWATIPGVINTTQKQFKDTSLVGGRTYEYRVLIHHPLGGVWNKYSQILEVTTEENPATAAAKEAALKAEQARVYAADSATKAEHAMQSADSTLEQVQNPTYGLNALRNEILNIKTTIDTNKPAPVINHLKALNNATATKSSTIVLDTAVSNATHYRINNGTWQEYTQSQLTFNNVTKGINRIDVEFGNFIEKDGNLEGNTTKGIVLIFGL